MTALPSRAQLPRASDRLLLGSSGLTVSPICIGGTRSPETIIAAFEEGINFFFVSADMHWPSYEATRVGLARLLDGNDRRRSEIVVAAVSYLANPLFETFGQFREVIAGIPGLKYLDVLVAGWMIPSLFDRLSSLLGLSQRNQMGVRAVGASFHHRPSALSAIRRGDIDIGYIRYNPCHPGARDDVFPHLHSAERTLVYNFKSMMYPLTAREFAALPSTERRWLPDCCDYYRFALSHPRLAGVLCGPGSPLEVRALVRALERRPLDDSEQNYMIRLCKLAFADAVERLDLEWYDSTVGEA